MSLFQLGDFVRIIDYFSLLPDQKPLVGQEFEIVEVESDEDEENEIGIYILKDAPSYFIEDELELIWSNRCFCDINKPFADACFECIERIYP